MFKDTLLKFLNLEGLLNNLTGYVETRVELIKIEVKEDLAKAGAKLVVFAALIVAALFLMLFISFAGAYWLGKLLGMPAGFSIVAGVYVIILLILLLLRKNIMDKLEEKFLRIIKRKQKHGNGGIE